VIGLTCFSEDRYEQSILNDRFAEDRTSAKGRVRSSLRGDERLLRRETGRSILISGGPLLRRKADTHFGEGRVSLPTRIREPALIIADHQKSPRSLNARPCYDAALHLQLG